MDKLEQREENTYIAIDLKSFYASVECVERGLNPLTTNLVVADPTRTEKTICLAVSPSLKTHGIGGRARLFEVVQKVEQVNRQRERLTGDGAFTGESYDANELAEHKDYKLSYIVAPPRMAYYMDYSTRIVDIYLKYVAPEDLVVYSIDEVFMDVTHYLKTYGMTAEELARKIIGEVLATTGITATAGIGTNLYLCKVAMDVMAKHIPSDKNGVRIAQLDELTYRQKFWDHKPITDFWRVGRGIAKKLGDYGMHTMGDVARCSVGQDGELYNEDLLYRLFGINAELLIDHAWGWEPVKISDIKAYKPSTHSLSRGQVLQHPYDYDKIRIIVKEMTDLLVLDIVEKRLVTNQLVLYLGYDACSLADPKIAALYKGEVTKDQYGKAIPKHSQSTINLEKYTSSTRIIMDAMMVLFDKIANPLLYVRRLHVVANNLVDEDSVTAVPEFEQLDLFTDYEALEKKRAEEEVTLAKEKNLQHAIIDLKKRFGKNALLKGMNLEEGATTIERNGQIGGHKA